MVRRLWREIWTFGSSDSWILEYKLEWIWIIFVYAYLDKLICWCICVLYFVDIDCEILVSTNVKTRYYPGLSLIGSLAMSYFRMVYPTLSSAITRFTVLFEMGRSGSRSLLSPSNSFARSSELCEFGLTDGFCFDIKLCFIYLSFSHTYLSIYINY